MMPRKTAPSPIAVLAIVAALTAMVVCLAAGCECQSRPPQGTLGTITLSTRNSESPPAAQGATSADGGAPSASNDGGPIVVDSDLSPAADR